jgi:hypothetical protein
MLTQAAEHLEPGGLLVCEIGDGKKAMQRRFPKLRLEWLKPEVFAYRPARTERASRTPPSRGVRGR